MSYSATINTQNDLLMKNLTDFYADKINLNKMMKIISGESRISLRIVDWFVTNYAKEYYTVYNLHPENESYSTRFKVYNDYKLKLKAYSKRRFDPFCRWERISIPYDNEKFMETTIGQLNFFKWAIESNIIDYIEENYDAINLDMNARNSASVRKSIKKTDDEPEEPTSNGNNKTRKKREELSVFACKCIKKESVKIVVKFNV